MKKHNKIFWKANWETLLNAVNGCKSIKKLSNGTKKNHIAIDLALNAIKTDENEVSLKGKVDSPYQKELAEKIT
ncbi:BON domain-containing protein [Flavobacterium sp.]|uniref:BON domain-containing protein n=1 Tax=Flavobacterium sp. TaxID=239 RepID=UPI0032660A60